MTTAPDRPRRTNAPDKHWVLTIHLSDDEREEVIRMKQRNGSTKELRFHTADLKQAVDAARPEIPGYEVNRVRAALAARKAVVALDGADH
ncbi:hypothetical protein [Kitasatospora sp. NPDC089509]|uniref:hypothetical protein n=1 Tax=Kitasatospora sp. NPDC089509 TaxID=3364079 RepID=UPI00381B4F16